MSSLASIRFNIRSNYVKIDPNAKVRADDTVDYFANIAYSKVQADFDFSIPECEGSTTINTVAGTQEYNKPSDFVRVTGLFYDSYKLTKVDKQYVMVNRGSQSKPYSYYLYGSNIGLYPTPDSSYTIDMLYAKQLPTLTDTIDSVLPIDMEDLVALWACYLMLLSVEKQAKASMALSQYSIAKDTLYGKMMYNDDNARFITERSNSIPRDNSL